MEITAIDVILNGIRSIETQAKLGIDKSGVYHISMEDYQEDPCKIPSLSRSTIIDLISRSPAHAWWNHPKLNSDFKKDEGEKKFDIGQAAHSLLLEGIDNVTVIEADDWRTKAAKEARDQARIEGKTPLLLHQYEEVKILVESAHKQILACKELGITDLQADGDSEMSYIWQEEATWLRVRPDWVSKDRKIILDYKTTGNSANPSEVARLIVSMGYDIQAALYSRGVKAIHGIDPKFIFIFQETKEPYLCSFVGLPPDFMEMGKQKVEYGIFLWQECMRSNQWPAYPSKVCWVDLPAWASVSWEKRATDLGIGE